MKWSLSYVCIAVAAVSVLPGGCTGPPKPLPSVQEKLTLRDTRPAPVLAMAQNLPQESSPLDAPPAMSLVFHVDIYQLSFPPGTYSRNEEFWKRIDEQCVDVATYDLLYKNGIRVGVADRSEMQHFQKFIEGVVPVERFTVTATEIRDVEVEAKMNLSQQTIFRFGPNHQLSGDSFDRCDNVISLSFEPAPRKPGALRMTLCPTVRAHRKHLEFSVTNEEREIEYVSPESLYDLNIRVDVPLDGIMILAPSENAHRYPSSVGSAFLTKDTPAQKLEQVLVVIPRPYRLGDPQDRQSVMPK